MPRLIASLLLWAMCSAPALAQDPAPALSNSQINELLGRVEESRTALGQALLTASTEREELDHEIAQLQDRIAAADADADADHDEQLALLQQLARAEEQRDTLDHLAATTAASPGEIDTSAFHASLQSITVHDSAALRQLIQAQRRGQSALSNLPPPEIDEGYEASVADLQIVPDGQTVRGDLPPDADIGTDFFHVGKHHGQQLRALRQNHTGLNDRARNLTTDVRNAVPAIRTTQTQLRELRAKREGQQGVVDLATADLQHWRPILGDAQQRIERELNRLAELERKFEQMDQWMALFNGTDFYNSHESECRIVEVLSRHPDGSINEFNFVYLPREKLVADYNQLLDSTDHWLTTLTVTQEELDQSPAAVASAQQAVDSAVAQLQATDNEINRLSRQLGEQVSVLDQMLASLRELDTWFRDKAVELRDRLMTALRNMRDRIREWLK